MRAELMGISLSDDRHYNKWIGFVRDAMSCLEISVDENSIIHSGWKHLPCAGGLYDQDEFLFRVWEMVRRKYIEAMTDKEFQQTIRKQRK